MKTAYDRDRAAKLVPLLRSITREIRERSRRVDALRSELGAARNEGSRGQRELSAELSIQLRELRHASAELDRLGCALDPTHPLRVLIPAHGGAAYAWRCGSNELEEEVADSAV